MTVDKVGKKERSGKERSCGYLTEDKGKAFHINQSMVSCLSRKFNEKVLFDFV